MVIRRRKLLTGAAAAAAIAALGYKQSRRAMEGDAGNNTVADGNVPESSIPASGERPNILLLCIDDLNDWVGYLGAHPGVYTPNIDRLRAQSYSFNRAYCSVPVCIASRASALWGLRPESTKVDDSEDYSSYGQLMQSPDVHPLPYWFSQAGYETVSTGKVFHLAMGTKRFWDVYKPYKDAPVSYGDHGTFFDYGVLAPGEEHPDQITAQFAIEQLNMKRSGPWFMALGL